MKTNQTNTDWTVGFAPLGSPSPRPSPLGRGRTVHRLWITSVAEFAQQLLAEHPSEARCSLSLREKVRVRGKYSVADTECSISQKLLSKNVASRAARNANGIMHCTVFCLLLAAALLSPVKPVLGGAVDLGGKRHIDTMTINL